MWLIFEDISVFEGKHTDHRSICFLHMIIPFQTNLDGKKLIQAFTKDMVLIVQESPSLVIISSSLYGSKILMRWLTSRSSYNLGGGNSNMFGIFTPILGQMIQFDIVLDGLKPPTRNLLEGSFSIHKFGEDFQFDEYFSNGL